MAQQERPIENQQQDAISHAVPEARPRPATPVGDQLRIARERRGQGVFEIADYLRIKPDYLSALERGAYDRLPAHAYVIGFLRSYAEYLGLDSMAVRAAYRQEISGQAKTPQLLMPQPLPEGKMPHLLLILGGILFAVGVYAAWYFSIVHDRAVVAPPSLIPAHEISEPPTPPSPGAAPGQGVLTTGTPLVGTPSNGSPAAIPLATTPAQVEASTTPTNAAPGVAKPDAAVDAIQNVDKTDKATRVMIRATRDSLITITDVKGKTVFNRILTTGSVYNVPDAPGFKLTTASAGSIVIVLDGKDLPKFGNIGQSLRDIALDPAVLAPKVP